MRLTVVTFGSEGDTRPFVGLCRGLMDSGHEVQLFADQASAYNAQLCGVPVQVLPGDVRSTLPIGNPSQEIRRAEVFQAIKACFRLIRENSAAWMKVVASDARRSDAILFAGLASPVARIVAEELRKPAIELWVTPTTPTRDYPAATLRPMHLPGWVNLLSHRLSPRAVMQRFFGKPAAAARKAIFGETSAAGGNMNFRSCTASPAISCRDPTTGRTHTRFLGTGCYRQTTGRRRAIYLLSSRPGPLLSMSVSAQCPAFSGRKASTRLRRQFKDGA